LARRLRGALSKCSRGRSNTQKHQTKANPSACRPSRFRKDTCPTFKSCNVSQARSHSMLVASDSLRMAVSRHSVHYGTLGISGFPLLHSWLLDRCLSVFPKSSFGFRIRIRVEVKE
jgi:hypothetical protein